MRTIPIRIAAAVFLTAAAGCNSTSDAHKMLPVVGSTSVAPKYFATPAMSTATSTPPFEGAIEVDVSGPRVKATRAITYDIKGKHVRYTETKAKKPVGVQAVADLAEHTAYALLASSKEYVELDRAAKPDDAAKFTLTKLGKSETIAGLTCEDWHITAGKRQVEVCAAQGLPYFDLMSRPRRAEAEPGWASALQRNDAFPLRVVEHDGSGKIAMSATATWVDRKHEDDSLFQVPTSYHASALPRDVRLPGLP